MNKFGKISLAGALIAAVTASTTVSNAQARDRDRTRGIIAGVAIGAVAGAIIASEVNKKKRKKRYKRQLRKRQFAHRGSRSHRLRHHNGYYRSGSNYHFEQPRVVYREPQPQLRYEGRISADEAHINWCHDRYRSYRAYDNSFQPYHGGRKQCFSPFN